MNWELEFTTQRSWVVSRCKRHNISLNWIRKRKGHFPIGRIRLIKALNKDTVPTRREEIRASLKQINHLKLMARELQLEIRTNRSINLILGRIRWKSKVLTKWKSSLKIAARKAETTFAALNSNRAENVPFQKKSSLWTKTPHFWPKMLL